MSFPGARIDGGFHVVKVDLPIGTLDLVNEALFADAGKFKKHGLVIVMLLWTRGAATTMQLINTQTDIDGVGNPGAANGTVIMPNVDSNILLERPGIGSENGHTISIVTLGGISQLVTVLVPEKQHQLKSIL